MPQKRGWKNPVLQRQKTIDSSVRYAEHDTATLCKGKVNECTLRIDVDMDVDMKAEIGECGAC
jgi:hypothetical protein